MIVAWPRLHPRQLALPLGFAAVFIALFWPTFRWMAERFDAADSLYSHGWLIPFASAWLVWQRRELLQRLPKQPSYAGLALLIPSVLVHVAGAWLRIGFLSGFAMLGVLYGLVWSCAGWPALWALRFPLLFLMFMVPLPGVMLIAASFKMKMAAATLATWVIRVIGIPALQTGSTIHVPGISVVVDDVCSGLRSLLSLVALAILWTSLMGPNAKTWQKGVLWVMAVPIAILANMVRVVMLVLLSAIYGPQIADSFIHVGSGIVTFGVALAALAWLGQSVQRWSLPSFAHNR